MEQPFLYLLKSSGLVAVFYLAYYFLVRKETFFTTSRWFLLSGLATSLLLPLYFIEKTIVIAKPQTALKDLVKSIDGTVAVTQKISAVEALDWTQLLWVIYVIAACVLVLKIVLNLASLYRMLHKQQLIKKESFKLINLNENIAPFSFFSYIVYNADLYTEEELKNILLHEKIHSKEKHSADVLFAEIMCAAFWFNPFMWLYKKAISQNLEYIADQKSIEQLEDKKSYQHALLKVVSNQNCLPITNNFYQSLIKKRIVMLNKNQSHRKNSWKYALVIPALIAFVFLFQVKVIARDKFSTTAAIAVMATDLITDSNSKEIPVASSTNDKTYVLDKITTDSNLRQTSASLKKDFNINCQISNVKRNGKGEITSIKIAYDDNKGNKGKVEQDRTIPIRPVFVKVSKSKDGKSSIDFYDSLDKTEKPANQETITNVNSTIETVTESSESTTTPQQSSPSIITLANGDEVVVFDKTNIKVVDYPSVKFTENSPVLILDGVPQKNPKLALEKMNLTKIKTIKVLNENDKEVKGTPIYKMILTTK